MSNPWPPPLGIAGAIIVESVLSFLGLAISLTVLPANYIGDGLRDALAPRIRGR